MACVDRDDALRTDLARFDDVIVKPLDPIELRMRVARLNRRSSSSAEHAAVKNDLDNIRKYADTFASTAEGIVVFGRHGKILFANPRAFEIMGHQEGSANLDDIWAYVHPDDRVALEGLKGGLARGEYPHGIDIHALRRDGSTIIAGCSFAPLIGSESAVVVSFQDVTEQRRIEQELVKTMEFLESLIDASVDGIAATDIDGKLILFNPSAERIYGFHAEDVIGRLSLSDLFHSADAEALRERLLSFGDADANDSRVEPMTMEAIGAEGESIPIRLSASIMYELGQPAAIVLIFTDLRERVRAERRLAEAQKQLQFTERQAVLAELAGTAAHELNQPLTSILAYAELLQRQSEEGSIGLKASSVLMREAERMAEIVRKIGRITKYETTSYVGGQKIFDLDRASESPTDTTGPVKK